MWQLADYTASLSLPALAAQINVLEPWAGLRAPTWFNTALPAAVSVLRVDARELIAPNRLPLDVYVRGSDLVATYAPSEGRNVQTQIYWRASQLAGDPPAAGIELIISAQTHLLDSRPTLSTASTLPGGDAFFLGGGDQLEPLKIDAPSKREFTADRPTTLLLFRPHGAAYSYAEMIYPSDFAGATLELRGENVLRLTSHLLAEHLEKGVIRRARLCGLFLPRTNDLARALAAYRKFVDEPLPLTA